MKIANVQASVHTFFYKLPLIENKSFKASRVICEVETDEGHVGVGMTAKFMTQAVAKLILTELSPVILGMDPRNLEKIHARLNKVVSSRGQSLGVNLSALSCVDLALWDIAGKHSDRTVAELLGGHDDFAECYVTFGFPDYDEDQLAQLAQDLVSKGHRRFKMLVGNHSGGIHEDNRRIRKVRDALGETVTLAIDANESLSLDMAIRLARLLEDVDIAWFEDPVWRNDPRDLFTLRSMTGIPISAGQMDGHSDRFRSFIEHDAIDIFMPNSLYNGGVTETRRVAHLAQIYNKPLSDAGGGGVFSLHHVAGFRNGTLAEVHLGTDEVDRQIFIGVPETRDGRLEVPSKPGFGITLDRSVMKETAIA